MVVVSGLSTLFLYDLERGKAQAASKKKKTCPLFKEMVASSLFFGMGSENAFSVYCTMNKIQPEALSFIVHSSVVQYCSTHWRGILSVCLSLPIFCLS